MHTIDIICCGEFVCHLMGAHTKDEAQVICSHPAGTNHHTLIFILEALCSWVTVHDKFCPAVSHYQ